MKLSKKGPLIMAALGISSGPSLARAQDDKSMNAENEVSPPAAAKRDSRDNRVRKVLTVSVIPLSLGWVLPTKNGVAATWIADEEWSIEAEYLRARYGIGFWGVDIANLSEQHAAIHTLYYMGNSFYFKAGLGRRTYVASFGSEYLSRISNQNMFAASDVRIANEVLTLGLGNRWLLDNGVTLGIEWLDLVFAIGKGELKQNFMNRVEDVGEQHELRDLFDYLRYGTTFQTMKLTLGYTF